MSNSTCTSDTREAGAGAEKEDAMGEPSPFGEHIGGGGMTCVGKFTVDACTGCAYVTVGETCTETGLTGVGPTVLNVPTATCDAAAGGAAAGAPRRPSKAAAEPCDVPWTLPGCTVAKDCGAAEGADALIGSAGKFGALLGGPHIIDPVSVGAI